MHTTTNTSHRLKHEEVCEEWQGWKLVYNITTKFAAESKSMKDLSYLDENLPIKKGKKFQNPLDCSASAPVEASPCCSSAVAVL